MNEDVIGILVTNQGTRPGTVSYPMEINNNTFPLMSLQVRGTPSTAVFLIEPGKSLLLQLTGAPGLSWDEKEVPEGDCEIELQKSDFKAKGERQWIIVQCKEISYFLQKFNEIARKKSIH
ncbi:MAG: hypothetical protein WBW81_09630 [Methylocella sp.]